MDQRERTPRRVAGVGLEFPGLARPHQTWSVELVLQVDAEASLVRVTENQVEVVIRRMSFENRDLLRWLDRRTNIRRLLSLKCCGYCGEKGAQ